MIAEKRCSVCKETKSVDLFGKDPTKHSKDGYKCRCKNCEKELGRLHRIKKAQEEGRELKRYPTDYQYDENGNCIARRCSICEEMKDAKEFSRDSHRKAGITNCCRACTKKEGERYRKQYKDEIRERKKVERNKPGYKEKSNQRLRAWRKRPESKASQARYQKDYDKRSYVVERKRKHYIVYRSKPENQEKARAYSTQYRKDHPELTVYNDNIRRTRELNAEGSHTLEQWKLLLSSFNCCPKCGKAKKLTQDHIIPLSKGGTDFIDNIQVLCFSCNASKRDIQIVDYRPKWIRHWAFAEMSFVYLDI